MVSRVTPALDTRVAVSEPPVELRGLVVPFIHADLESPRPSWRGGDQPFRLPHERGPDPEPLQRREDAEGPQVDDALAGLAPVVDPEAPDGSSVHERKEEDGVLACSLSQSRSSRSAARSGRISTSSESWSSMAFGG